MRLSDDVHSQLATELPLWVPKLWHPMQCANPRELSDMGLELLGPGQGEEIVDAIRRVDEAAFTCPRAVKVRKRRHSWFLHLLKEGEIVISWCASEPIGVVPPGVPESYVRMLESLGRLSFMRWWTSVHDIADMKPENEGIDIECVLPFFPHGNGDFDVFHTADQRVLTFDHECLPGEEGQLIETASSFEAWLGIRLTEYWRGGIPLSGKRAINRPEGPDADAGKHIR